MIVDRPSTGHTVEPGSVPASATPSALGDEPTVVLRFGSATAEVALRGATLLRWLVHPAAVPTDHVDPDAAGPRADLGTEPFDLLDGYRTAEELRAQDGIRNGIMAPFCDRIADARYAFEGVEHDLLPGQVSRLIYHGFVRTMPFTLESVAERADGLTVTLRCEGLATDPQPGYPFPVDVEVTYTLARASLGISISAHNRGTTPAPFASGWHPYFRLPGAPTVDSLDLELATDVRVETSPTLIPHPGPAAYSRIEAAAARWAPVGDAVLDVGFLAHDGQGAAVLSDPTTGLRVTLLQDRGLVHVFTGDTLARDRRASIAVEPVEAVTDAFNRPDCRDAVRLEPGARRTFGATVTVTR